MHVLLSKTKDLYCCSRMFVIEAVLEWNSDIALSVPPKVFGSGERGGMYSDILISFY